MLPPPGMGKRQICKEAEKQRSVLCLWREMHLPFQWLRWIYNSCTFSRDIYSLQEEADTRIILHCQDASRQPSCLTIVVRSPDTDVFLLVLSFSETIGKTLVFYTGCGNNRRQINVSQIAKTLSKQLCYALLGVHAFTGYDTTSCFAGQGKLKALKLVQKEEYLRSLFSRFGTSTVVSSNDYLILESIDCNWSPSAACYLLPFVPAGL